MRVDFYLMKDNDSTPESLACRLLEKAYFKGHQVFVYCSDQQAAETLDELLWTFRKESFVPHNLQGEGPEPPPPIQIGYEKEPRGFNDILLNMSESVPDFYSRFKRIIEIVPNEEEAKHISRKHYRYYKKNAADIKTHELTTKKTEQQT